MTVARLVAFAAALVTVAAAVAASRDAARARRFARTADRHAWDAFLSKLDTSIDSSTARLVLASVRKRAARNSTDARRRSGGAT